MDEIREILIHRNYSRLAMEKRVVSRLISFLYGDELLIFRSAEAIGLICGEIGRADEEFVKRILRRLFWHLNDESGAYCKGAPVAIGEIGRNAATPFEGFKNMTVSLLDNGEVERKYVIYAIGRAARNIHNAYPNPVEKLVPLLKHESPEIRAYTAYSLGELGDIRVLKYLEELLADKRKTEIYNEYFEKVRVCDVASKAIKTILATSQRQG
jgi:hypothetical protein